MRLDYRQNKDDDGKAVSAIPSIRFNYLWSRDIQFELEVGADWTRTTTNGVDDTTMGYLILVGHRIDF